MKKLIVPFQLLVAAILAFWILFFHLGQMPFRVWDESRLVTSAYEMTKNHQYLTPTIENTPDMWNTKPPLMIWAEALCIKIFGFREWSVRLPAALCGLLTIFLLVVLVRKIVPDGWSWLVVVIVLCTSTGFMGYHTVRGAEYDGMLMLFVTAYLFCFFAYTENTGSERNKYLLYFFAFLSLACLTKGIAGLLITPALFIYLVFRKQLIATLTNKYTYIGVFAFIFFVMGYYLLREKYNPGYIQAVAGNELGSRFAEPIQGAVKVPWYFYLDIIRWAQFSTWFWALPLSLILIGFLENGRVFRLAGFCWLAAIIFISVISISGTKYGWYDLPVFPLLAVIVAVVIYQLSGIANRLLPIKRQVAAFILVVIFSVQPVFEAYNYILWQNDDLEKDNFYAPSYFFRQALIGKRNLNGYFYLTCCYSIQWRLYIKMLNDRGIHVEDGNTTGERLNAGDHLIANQSEVMQDIEKNYYCTVSEDFYGVKTYIVDSIK